VGGSGARDNMRDVFASRRFVMRLKGFSSTLRRRDLWRASSSRLVSLARYCRSAQFLHDGPETYPLLFDLIE
jgi:hypothetical protein